MKMCDYCGKPFLPNGVHITEQHKGSWQSFVACKGCAQKLVNGESMSPLDEKPTIEIELVANSPEELIKTAEGIMELLSGKVEERPKFFDKEPCPHCGLTIEEFLNAGKFGCEHCYTHYDEELLPILMIHQDGHDSHLGKIPKHWQELQCTDPKEKRKLLLLKKAKAVELEQYEEAAKIAEEIRKLDSSFPP